MTDVFKMEGLYFQWLKSFVCNSPSTHNYDHLLIKLHRTVFFSKIPMDDNRVQDAVDLRYRFGMENNIPECEITYTIDDHSECSVLELMVALALRCGERIIHDEDQIAEFFWEMVRSLTLYSMTDDNFDAALCDKKLSDFIERRYFKNGKGSLFEVSDPDIDMRSVEIWYQMMLFLNEELTLYL